MNPWLVQLGAPVLALLLGLAVFVWLRRRGEALWDRLSRGLRGEADYLERTLGLMFRPLALSRCRLVVFAATGLGALVGGQLAMGLSLLPQVLVAFFFAWLFSRLPRQVVRSLHRRYLERFDDQLADALTMAASALRSGLSLPQALDLVTREMPAPIGQEFALALKEQRVGKTLEEALDAMADRLPSLDLALVVNAVLVLRETGGNLSETFDTIVHTISERDKVRGKIKTLTAQGVAQGIILTGMPFVLAWVLHLLNPDYMRPLFTTLAGWVLLFFMGLMLLVGGLMIRKIVSIDV